MEKLPVAREIVQGSTRPTLPLKLEKDDGSPVVITGATMTGKIRKMNMTTSTALAGTITVGDGSLGEATLAYAAGDVALAGTFVVEVTAILSGQTYKAQFIQPIREAL